MPPLGLGQHLAGGVGACDRLRRASTTTPKLSYNSPSSEGKRAHFQRPPSALDCHEEGPPLGDTLRLSPRSELKGGPTSCYSARIGSRRREGQRLLLSETGEHLDQLAAPPDADSLRRLARPKWAGPPPARVRHNQVDDRRPDGPRHGGGGGVAVEFADAQKVKVLAPLACKTDKIDSQVLAKNSQRDLVRRSGFPSPGFERSGSWPTFGFTW